MPLRLLFPLVGGGSSIPLATLPKPGLGENPASSSSSKRHPNIAFNLIALAFVKKKSVCSLVSIYVSVLLFVLLLSHLGLAKFSVDSGWADSEIRGFDGAKHSYYYRM